MAHSRRSSLGFPWVLSGATSIASTSASLRALQQLGSIEKRILNGIRGLAEDLENSVMWLRDWGMGEGDDLEDVLFHSTNLLTQFSAGLVQFASYSEQVRAHLKLIRTREQRLSKMKKRKRGVDYKVDMANKKLNKMSPEHNGRIVQVELCNGFAEEARLLNVEVAREEATLGDYKRQAAKEFMELKFAGVLELGEKMTVIGSFGKLVVEEVPLGTTFPGHPRAPYMGREVTASVSSQAMHRIGRIRINIPAQQSSPAASREPQSQTPNGNATELNGVPEVHIDNADAAQNQEALPDTPYRSTRRPEQARAESHRFSMLSFRTDREEDGHGPNNNEEVQHVSNELLRVLTQDEDAYK